MSSSIRPRAVKKTRTRITDRTVEGADQHIDAMAKKYLGQDKYPYRRPGEVRVIYKVQPEHITSMM